MTQSVLMSDNERSNGQTYCHSASGPAVNTDIAPTGNVQLGTAGRDVNVPGCERRLANAAGLSMEDPVANGSLAAHLPIRGAVGGGSPLDGAAWATFRDLLQAWWARRDDGKRDEGESPVAVVGQRRVRDWGVRGAWVRATGTSFGDRPGEILALVEPGRSVPRLEIVPEPDNPADPHAMGIWLSPRIAHLGWVPRDVAAEMDPHAEWVVAEHRVQIHPDAPTRPGLDVRIVGIEWAPDPEVWVAAGRDPSVGRSHRAALVPARLRERVLVGKPEVLEAGGGVWAVASGSSPGTWRAVVMDETEDGVAEFMCGCPSGFYRPDHLVPCVHAAAVGVWLEQLGQLGWDARCELWRTYPRR